MTGRADGTTPRPAAEFRLGRAWGFEISAAPWPEQLGLDSCGERGFEASIAVASDEEAREET